MKRKFRKNIAISALILSMLPSEKIKAEAIQEELVETKETEQIEEVEQIQEDLDLIDETLESENDSESSTTAQSMMTRSVAEFNVLSQRNVHYVAKVIKPWSINSEPWGTEGSETVLNAAHELVGKSVEVVQEKTTEKSTYVLLQDGNNVIGWIDITGIAKHTVTSTKNVNYVVEIIRPWSINTQPWGIEGSETVDTGQNYLGESLNVIQEKVTERSTYLLLQKNGQTIGWIDQSGVEKHQDILSVKNTTYVAKVINPWSINTAPFDTSEAKTIHSNSSRYLNSVVEVIQEKTTPRSTYALITINGTELGWIDVTALEKQTILSTKNVNYQAEMIHAWSINSKPWGVEGYTTNYTTPTEFLNSVVTVSQEQVTPRSTYALISLEGQTLGWVDKGALNLHPVLSTNKTNYKARIVKPWSINTKPWGTSGYKTVVNDSSYVGKTVDIVQEKQTPRSTYGLIQENGKKIGWIDLMGVEKIEVLSTKNVHYAANITKPWSINTKPWGTNGSEEIKKQTSLVGETVVIKQEQTTPKSTYALITKNGKEIGWIDITGIKAHSVKSTKEVYYSVNLTQPWSINTKPWGIEGFSEIENSSGYVGGIYDVVEEKTTPRATYGLLSKTGKDIGWVDLSAVTKNKEFNSMKKTNYASIVNLPWSINTEPWGTSGFKSVNVSAESLVGRDVQVIAEKVTDRSTYALITQNNKTIGWIDTGALITYTMQSTKNVYYNAKIEKPWSINTKPWGVKGYKTIANYTSYVGDTVRVVQETTTQKSTYALIEKNGKTLGWIDKTGIREVRPVIYLDPGHGGTDPGAVGNVNSRQFEEADLNLQVSLKIRDLLEKEGYSVIMSRETDKTVGLYDRPEQANETNATLFISVHFNALKGSTAAGIETYYYRYNNQHPSKLGNQLHNDINRVEKSKNLAIEIHNELISNTKAVNRGVRRSSFAVIRESEVPAVLLELGFMSSPSELSKMVRNDYQNTLARSVVKGIINYYNK